ncbi:MAG: hypothetical protein ABSF71_35560 [Terriglobia bacterium]
MGESLACGPVTGADGSVGTDDGIGLEAACQSAPADFTGKVEYAARSG